MVLSEVDLEPGVVRFGTECGWIWSWVWLDLVLDVVDLDLGLAGFGVA